MPRRPQLTGIRASEFKSKSAPAIVVKALPLYSAKGYLELARPGLVPPAVDGPKPIKDVVLLTNSFAFGELNSVLVASSL